MPEIVPPRLQGVYVFAQPQIKEGRFCVTLIDAVPDQDHAVKMKLTLDLTGVPVNAVIAVSNFVSDYQVSTKAEAFDRVTVEIAAKQWAISPENSFAVNTILENSGCAILCYDHRVGFPAKYLDVLGKVLAERIPLYLYPEDTLESLQEAQEDKSFNAIFELVREEWHDGKLVVPNLVFMHGFDGLFWVHLPPDIAVY